MKAVVCFVMLAFGSVVTDMAGECDMAGLYLELGCKPLPKIDNSTICPDAFECPDLHPDPTMCYYRGVPYKERQSIPQALITNPCSKACSCQFSDGPIFECAAVDCVESLEPDLKQDCIRTYDLKSCCSTGSVCGKDAIAALKTCEFDGKTYREGEVILPKNTMKACICTGEWNGSTEGAHCMDINCGTEIHNQNTIAKNCAPVFSENKRSCPVVFQCPTPKSEIIRGLNRRGVNSQCTFGYMTLNVGDEVTVEEFCMRCFCEVPPFVTCLQNC